MPAFIISLFIFSLSILELKAQKPQVFETDGKAVHGYDAVAYFSEDGPVKGYDSLSVQWNNSSWLFSTRANMNMFTKNPEQYAPQYGGYCAYGTAGGYKAPTQADTWAVVNGKLYFNYNKKVKEMWDKNQPVLIEKANINWVAIKNK